MAKTTYSREELERQLSESRREFWAADATINNLELKLAEMEAQLSNAEKRIAELEGLEMLLPGVRATVIHGSEPETDNTAQQFESLSRGDK